MAKKSCVSTLVFIIALLTGCNTPAGNEKLILLLAGFRGGDGVAPDGLAYQTMSAVYRVDEPIAPNEPVYEHEDQVLSWSVSPSLPDGLDIDPLTGVISGTPAAVRDEARYTVTALLPKGSVEAELSITVTIAAPSGLAYASPFAAYPYGEPIAPNVPTVAGTVSEWSASPALPDGLALDSVTGVISGTPSSAQASISYAITASNSSGSATATIHIAVCGAPGRVEGLVATQGTYADRVVLTWQAAENAGHYLIYRSDNTASMQILDDVATATFTDTTVGPGSYFYLVVGYTDCGTEGPVSDMVTGYRAISDQEFFDQAYWEIESVVDWLQSSDLTESQPAVPGMVSGDFKYDLDVLSARAYVTFTDYSDYYLTVDNMLTIRVSLLNWTGTITGTLDITGIYTGYVTFDSIVLDLDTSEFTGGHYDVSQDGGATETRIDYTYLP